MKLFVTDLDGTLLKEGNIIESETLKAIEQYKKNGNILMIATGRAVAEVDFLKKNYNIDYDAMAILNGAMILDSNNNELKKDTIQSSIVKKLEKYYFFKNRNIYIASEDEVFNYNLNNKCTNVVNDVEQDLDCIKNIVTINIEFEEDVPYEEIDEYLNIVKKENKEHIDLFRNKNFIDIVPKGCSKGNAVEIIAQKFKIDEDKIFCIGDSWNDLSMIETATVGATFKHAEESLKSKVDKVVENIKEFIDYINVI